MRVLILCLTVSMQMTAAFGTTEGQARNCPGAYSAATWTNCVGTYAWPDGRKYVGRWKDGKFNGQGTHTYADGGTYIGEWKDDKRHGQGSFAYPDGGKYGGEWKNGKSYRGEYKDGRPDGKGTMTLPDGRRYVGEFRSGKYNGQGTYTWPNGDRYVGGYRDDKRHGHGAYTHFDGEKYVGEFMDDKAHGQGTMTLPDGRKYVGEFRNGEPHGKGVAYHSNGSVLRSGIWQADRTGGLVDIDGRTVFGIVFGSAFAAALVLYFGWRGAMLGITAFALWLMAITRADLPHYAPLLLLAVLFGSAYFVEMHWRRKAFRRVAEALGAAWRPGGIFGLGSIEGTFSGRSFKMHYVKKGEGRYSEHWLVVTIACAPAGSDTGHALDTAKSRLYGELGLRHPRGTRLFHAGRLTPGGYGIEWACAGHIDFGALPATLRCLDEIAGELEKGRTGLLQDPPQA